MNRRVTLKAGDDAYLFRLPTLKDMWTIEEMLPLLPVSDFPDDQDKRLEWIDQNPDKVRQLSLRELNQLDALLMLCCLSPEIIPDSPVEVPEGKLPVDEIPAEHRIALGRKLKELAGWTKEAAEGVRPLSEIVEVCEPLTSLPDATGAAPATTSAT